MDLTKNSFLLEIGTEGNTLDEACYSGRLFADALADMLLEEYVKNKCRVRRNLKYFRCND